MIEKSPVDLKDESGRDGYDRDAFERHGYEPFEENGIGSSQFLNHDSPGS